MTRNIETNYEEWALRADQDLTLDETDDYVLAQGGVLNVSDGREGGEHVEVSVYPEDGDSASLTITAEEAASLGRWLVKTFGD
jgi:hypothetical protein